MTNHSFSLKPQSINTSNSSCLTMMRQAAFLLILVYTFLLPVCGKNREMHAGQDGLAREEERQKIQTGPYSNLIAYKSESFSSNSNYYISVTPEKLNALSQSLYGVDYITVVNAAVKASEKTLSVKEYKKLFARAGDHSSGFDENISQYWHRYKIAALPNDNLGVAKNCGATVGEEITGLIFTIKSKFERRNVNDIKSIGQEIAFANYPSDLGEGGKHETLIYDIRNKTVNYYAALNDRRIIGYVTPNEKKYVTAHYLDAAIERGKQDKRANATDYFIFDSFYGVEEGSLGMLERLLGAKISIEVELKSGLTNKELLKGNTFASRPLKGSLAYNLGGSIRKARGLEPYNGSLWITDILTNFIKQGLHNLKIFRTDNDGSVLWVITSNDLVVFSLIAPHYSPYGENYTPLDFIMNEDLFPIREKYFDLVMKTRRGRQDTPQAIPSLSKDGFYWSLGGDLFTPKASKQEGKIVNLENRDLRPIHKILLKNHFEFINNKFVIGLDYAEDKEYYYKLKSGILLPEGIVSSGDDKFPVVLQVVDGYTVITTDIGNGWMTYAYPSSFHDNVIGRDNAIKERERQQMREVDQINRRSDEQWQQKDMRRRELEEQREIQRLRKQ